MSLLRGIAIAALAGLAFGCTTGARDALVTRPARPAGCDIQVVEGNHPDRPFARLGEIRMTSVVRDRAEVIGRLSDEACRLGADAIMAVSSRYSPASGGPTMGPRGIGGPGETMWTAVAITWTGPPPAPTPAP